MAGVSEGPWTAGGRHPHDRPMRITLRQLAVFEAVARTGSIVRAAADIGLSPSAASMSLKDLEAHLGVELFARQGKKLLLSDHGREVREKAKSVLRQAEELEALVSPSNLHGRLRVGATAPIGAYVLPPLLALFMKKHPEVVVELSVTSSMEITDRVQKMSLDVGLISAPCNSNYIDPVEWMRDPLVICCAPDNPLGDGRAVSIVEIRDRPWIMEKALSSERTSFTVEILKHVASLRVAFEADNIETIKRLVKTSDGLACLSQVSVQDEFARGELKAVNVREFGFSRIFSIILRRDVYRSQLQTAFVNFLTAAADSEPSVTAAELLRAS